MGKCPCCGGNPGRRPRRLCNFRCCPATERSLREARDNFERAYILTELRANDWNMTRTAERLGIERSHLYRKIKLYGITPPR